MNPQEMVQHARRIISETANVQTIHGSLVEAREFMKEYAGPDSNFYKQLQSITGTPSFIASITRQTLEGFVRYVEHGLLNGTSIKRQAEIDVVSDFLDQAQTLLNSPDIHPAAPAVIVGAALEQFLRSWVEEAGLFDPTRRGTIETYNRSLYENKLISKQDTKDITSWAGVRNSAAHGNWDEVQSKEQVSLVLAGVNLFMRKYSSKPTPNQEPND